MKKIIIAFVATLTLVALMFAEYRVIMNNIKPYYADGYVYIETMGHTDVYK